MSNVGNVYIADSNNNRIRKVTVSTGSITTIAGTGSTTYNGDSIAATSATLKYPYGVALDASGRILITVCCTATQYYMQLVMILLIIMN